MRKILLILVEKLWSLQRLPGNDAELIGEESWGSLCNCLGIIGSGERDATTVGVKDFGFNQFIFLGHAQQVSFDDWGDHQWIGRVLESVEALTGNQGQKA